MIVYMNAITNITTSIIEINNDSGKTNKKHIKENINGSLSWF